MKDDIEIIAFIATGNSDEREKQSIVTMNDVCATGDAVIPV